MTRVRMATVLAVVVALVSIVAVSAEVKTQEKTQVKFEGTLGRMMGLFGGKAAKEGVVSTVAVKGDRKMRVSDTRGELVDLAEEKVYAVDFKNKSYKVQTFAEIRRQMEEQMRKAKEEMAKTEGKQSPSGEEPQMEFEVTVKETGQRKTVNGFDCREVVMTMLMHEKGKKIEESGGLVFTANMWLAPKNRAMQEIVEFDMKYWKALQTPAMAEAQQAMAQALVLYPGLGQAFTKFQSESVNVDGTPILTTVTIESAQTAEQAAQAEKQEQAKPSGGIGGVMGGLGGFGRKKPDASTPPASGTPPTKRRVTVMTTISEVLSVQPSVSDADVSVPAGFKQK